MLKLIMVHISYKNNLIVAVKSKFALRRRIYMNKNYTVGLDIGTNSVGFVAIDENMKILKYNDRFAFGSHEFVGAETAEATRLKRGGRRRYNRRKKRLQLVQEQFKEHMEHQNFFSEKESQHFWRNSNEFENRTLSEVISKVRLKQKDYPTIYHLRHQLILSNEKADLRLIYLAIHNLVKYRGHFLQQGEWGTKSTAQSIANQLEDLLVYYNEVHQNNELALDSINYNTLENILKDQRFSRKEKLEEVQKNLSTKDLDELFKLIIALTTRLDKLFPKSADLESKSKKSFSFLKHEVVDFTELLTDTEQEFFELVTPLYQDIQMFELLKGKGNVAEAKVEAFKQYGKDLDELQKFFNTYIGEEGYRAFFLTPKSIMKAYHKDPIRNLAKLSIFDQFLRSSKFEEEFYKKLSTALKKAYEPIKDTVDGQKIKVILDKIADESFLNKLKSKLNASIPYQNNVFEAQQILKNQQQYYDFIDDDFITRIKQIISFRIPYYIGPLTKGEQEKFGWLVRNNGEENITPFNFEQVIDKSESAERFIRRMTNKCSYLKAEDVLPKASLLYEEYELLNELNVVQIRQETDDKNADFRLSMEEKQWAIDNVFFKTKTVKLKRLLSELKKSPFARFKTDQALHVYGTQKEDQFATSLSMHIDLDKIFGKKIQTKRAMMEEIIEWLTIFEEREIFILKMKEKYPEVSEEQLEKLVRLKPTGWGRLSAKLLDELPVVEYKTGEISTIIEKLRDTNQNFMELMSTTDLKKQIEKIHVQGKKTVRKIKYADVAELPGSPALKRGIWHAVKIVEELTTIFGEPANIVLEVARLDDKKQRTISRENLLKEYQSKARLDKDKELELFLKKHNTTNKLKVDKERIWLYLTQGGKCLYTGEKLELDELSQYQVDHILPQNFVKDNSLSNKALVKTKYNQAKAGDKTPLQVIPAEKQGQMKAIWRKLEKLGMISRKKYESLMKPYFSNADKEGFIARQLVETRQIIKNIEVLLEERFGNTSVHALKAGIVSKLRQSLNMPKIRNLNNKHHAMDALYSASFIQMILNEYGYNFLEFTMEKQALYDKWNRKAQSTKNFFLFDKLNQLEFQSNIQNKKLSAHEYYREAFEKVSWNTTKQKRFGEEGFYNETIYSPKSKDPEYASEKTKKAVYSSLKKRCSWIVSYVEIAKSGKQKELVKIQDIQTIDYQQAQQHGLCKEQLAEIILVRNSKAKVAQVKVIYELQNYQKVIEDGQPYYFMSSKERHVGKQFELNLALLDEISEITLQEKKFAEEATSESLKVVFDKVTEVFFEQYPYFAASKMKEKIEAYSEAIKSVEDFKKGLDELYKSAQNSGARSDLFGSRLTKGFDLGNLYIIEESITGLHHRKPKKIL